MKSSYFLGVVALVLLFPLQAGATDAPVTGYLPAQFYTVYSESNKSPEELTKQLKKLNFVDPTTHKKFTLDIQGPDPLLHAKPTQVLAIGGMLVPTTLGPDTQSGATLSLAPKEGSKISLVQFRILESIPEQVRKRYNGAPSDVTISYDASDTAHPYRFEGTYSEGQEIFEERLMRSIAERLQTGSLEPIMLPVIRRAPSVHTVGLPEEIGPIHDLVAYGVSDFTGSTQDRIHNIRTALAHFNGIVVAPGQVFSFNEFLGPVDDTTGYKKELVIKGPRTIPEFGGGVCQVSSTAFRAALYGGLPIVERKNHSYAVSYYQPWGTDATIYPGVVDFKFRNDTPGSLVIQAYVEEPHVYFKFYGVKDTRQVTMDGPHTYGHTGPPASINHPVSWLAAGQKQMIQHGVGGFFAHWNRTVTYPDGHVVDETFKSNYEARPAHYNVGPAAAPAPETATVPAP